MQAPPEQVEPEPQVTLAHGLVQLEPWHTCPAGQVAVGQGIDPMILAFYDSYLAKINSGVTPPASSGSR